jgi:leader peptidase (prepilin peptidase)/N-methyltransferase
MNGPWYIREYAGIVYGAAAVFGLIVGSFLNVVIYRLPRDLSIVRPRSFCPRCRRQIPWYENIPIVSYLALGGRCRGCGSPVSITYPLVEAAGAALALVSLARFGFTVDAAFAYAFLMALTAITIIDWRFRIIPDEVSMPFILVGLAWSMMSPERTVVGSALGALVGGGGLYLVALLYKLLRRREGLGGGDIKLMAMVGAFLGVKLVLVVILLASAAGSLYGVVLLRSGKNARTAVAFGSFLAPAAAVCLLYGTRIISWYLGAFASSGTLHTNLAIPPPVFFAASVSLCNRMCRRGIRRTSSMLGWHACCVLRPDEEIGP